MAMKELTQSESEKRERWVQHAIETQVHPKNVARNPQKYVDQFVRLYARLQVLRAVKRGTLIKPSSCSVCGEVLPAKQIQGHHPDYDRPLDVEWVCRPCHQEKHKGRFFRSIR